MLSLEKCKEILNAGNRKYSNEEVLHIRAFLYKVAAIEQKEYKQKSAKTTSTNNAKYE